MNILVISHNIPYPPNKGEKIRSHHMLSELAKDNNIHLVSFLRNKEDAKYKKDLLNLYSSAKLIPLNWFISKLYALLALISGKPLTLGFFHSFKIKKDINDTLGSEKIDIILSICSSSAKYCCFKCPKQEKIYKTTDFIDIDSIKWKTYSEYSSFPKSWIYSREHKLLAKHEKEVASNSRLSAVTSKKEKKHLEKITKSAKSMVVPLAVDTDFFKPESITPKKQIPNNKASNKLIFTGQMNYLPNVDAVVFFYLNILPLIRSIKPEVEFLIVGRAPSPRLKNICTEATITGEVDDIRPWLQKADVFVAPMRLSFGVQNKVLEAMASKIPVVASEIISESFSGVPGEDYLAAKNNKDFAKLVIELLKNENKRKEQAEKAFQFITRVHDCKTVSKEFKSRICKEATVEVKKQ